MLLEARRITPDVLGPGQPVELRVHLLVHQLSEDPIEGPLGDGNVVGPGLVGLRRLWMGHTSTGAAVGHEALLSIAYCTGIVAVSAGGASWLFGHRTAA